MQSCTDIHTSVQVLDRTRGIPRSYLLPASTSRPSQEPSFTPQITHRSRVRRARSSATAYGLLCRDHPMARDACSAAAAEDEDQHPKLRASDHALT